MDGIWAFVATALGGGALGTIVTKGFDFLIASKRQPVDQYDLLTTKLSGLIDQERVHFEARLEQERNHCDSRIVRLEQEADKACEREQKYNERESANSRKIGELEGRLDEQRQMLKTIFSKAGDMNALAMVAEDQTQGARG